MVELRAFHPKFVDDFGEVHQEQTVEWIPNLNTGFGLSAHCYVIVENWRGRYYIKECVVESYWYTGIWGYKMTNGWCFEAADEGKRLFTRDELQTAIEICEKKNRMRKVRIKKY